MLKKKQEEILPWILEKKLKTDDYRDFEFHDHRFLVDYLTNFSKRIVIRKCTQVGFSLATLLKLLYLADTKTHPVSVLYTLPTDPDTKDFVRTKFDPLVFNSLLKEHAEGVNRKEKVYSIKLKKIKGSNFYFRGARSLMRALSISADIWVGDEIDYQSEIISDAFEERLKGSQSLGMIWQISNPSYEGVGISKLYEESNQNEWWIRCPYCNKYQRLTWPESVDLESKIFICKNCKRKLERNTRARGIWRPKYPDRETEGYAISRLMAPWIPASDIIKSYETKTPKHFSQFVLGEPFRGNQAVEVRKKFRKYKTKFVSSTGTRIVGIDQGDSFHVTSAILKNDILVHSKFAVVSELQDLSDLLTSLAPDFVVMDALPNKHTARFLQNHYGRKKFFLALERDWRQQKHGQFFEFDRKQGVVHADRTEIIDAFFDLLENSKIRIYDKSGMLEDVKKHLGGVVPDTREINGLSRRIYKKTGINDFLFAMTFALLGVLHYKPNFASPKVLDKKNDDVKVKGTKDHSFGSDPLFRKAILGHTEGYTIIRPKI